MAMLVWNDKIFFDFSGAEIGLADSMGAKEEMKLHLPVFNTLRRKILEIGCGTGCIGIGLCNLPLKEQPKN